MKQGIVVELEWRVLHINFGLTFRAKIAIISIGSLSSMIFRFSTPRPHGIQAAPNAVRRHGTNFRAKPRQYLTILEQGGSLIWLLSLIVPVYYDVYGKEVMHYSMLIQGSPTNGTFQWINPYKYRNPYITSITVLFRPNQVMFNNVDTTIV